MGRLRLGLQRGLALGSVLALLLALAGFGLIAPVALASDFTSCPTVADLQDVLTNGGTLNYTGSTACSIPLSGALTVVSGVSAAIDGGTAGLTLTNTSASANLINAVSLSSGQSLTLNHITLITGDNSIDIYAATANGAITVTNSTLNLGDDSIGIDASAAQGAITVTNSTLSSGENSYGIVAGSAHGAITVTNSILTSGENSYSIYTPAASSAIAVTNSTLAVGEDSYGIFADSASGAITLTNSTITTGEHGTSIDANDVTKPTTITASILAGTESSNSTNCVGSITDGGYNLSGSVDGSDDSCGFSGSTTHSQNVKTSQLNLQPLAGNGGPTETEALGPDSVAIDAIPVNGQGACAVGEQIDQRGVPRPQGVGCDIGAYEVAQSTTFSVCPNQAQLQGSLDIAPGDGTAYTITLPPNCTVTLADHGLSVGAGVNIILNGNGLTLDGQNQSFDIIDVHDSNSHPSTLVLNQVILEHSASGVVESSGRGTVSLTGSTIRDMTSSGGAAYGVDAYNVNLSQSTISGIRGTGGASAYAVSGNSVTLNQSTINAIHAASAAAGILTLGSSSVTSSTITGIISTGSGSGAFGLLTLGPGLSTVTSSTIIDITASGQGSQGDGVAAYSGSITVAASILADNGTNCSGTISDGGYNLSTDSTCRFAPSTANNVTDAQLNLQPLTGNGGPTKTIALGPVSVALNAIPLSSGQCSVGEQIDQRGVSRPQGSQCDIGAYEATNGVAPLPGTTTTVRQGYYAVIRVEALSTTGQNISSRNLNVTSVELDGPDGQVVPFAHPFRFGRFSGTKGYQLSINTRNLAKGDWMLVVKVGSGRTATSGWVTFTVR